MGDAVSRERADPTLSDWMVVEIAGLPSFEVFSAICGLFCADATAVMLGAQSNTDINNVERNRDSFIVDRFIKGEARFYSISRKTQTLTTSVKLGMFQHNRTTGGHKAYQPRMHESLEHRIRAFVASITDSDASSVRF